MVIKNVHFKSLIVSGLIAGWMMYFVDHWFSGLFGLFGMFPGPSNWGWMLTHHVESILFAIPFAWLPLYKKLPGPGWLKGSIYGFLWWLVFLLIIGSIAGALGAKPFQMLAPTSAGILITVILLHVIWGFFLGVFYIPPEEKMEEA